MSASPADVRRAQAIIARVRKTDVRVLLVGGWESRGRPQAFDPRTVTDHHDASSIRSGEWGALPVVTTGYGSLPGPLSQFTIARCLRVPQIAVVAAGRANHAGLGGPLDVGGGLVIPKDSANRYSYGVEKANNGLDERATDEADYAADVLFAAILEVVS